MQNERKINICVIKENVSRETLKNKKNKKNGKTMFHVKHFMDKYLEK